MQSRKLSLVETFIDILLANLINALLVLEAIYIFKIPIQNSFLLWAQGQFLSIPINYFRRRYFNKIN